MSESERGLGDLLGDPEWVRSRREQPRIEAEDLVFALSKLAGEDPDSVLEELHKDEPLARAVRKLLSIHARPRPRRGPRTDRKQDLEDYIAFRTLRNDGLRGDKLWEVATSRLGRGRSIEAFQKAIARTKKRYPIARAFSNRLGKGQVKSGSCP